MMPTCPRCDEPPTLVVGDRQAFCGTNGCPVFTWDLAATLDEFKANAYEVEIETDDV